MEMNDKSSINPNEFVELMDSFTESQIVFIKSGDLGSKSFHFGCKKTVGRNTVIDSGW
jgi:hypothetical protein